MSISPTRASTSPDGFRRCATLPDRSTSAATTSMSRWHRALPICRMAEGSRRATACSRSATPTSRPVVGKLELDIAGDASSVTQLASYEPIDAMARTGMSPDEFSGEVTGHVTADIPLDRRRRPQGSRLAGQPRLQRSGADQADRRPAGLGGGGKHHRRSAKGGDQGQGQAERRARRHRHGRADRRRRTQAQPQHRGGAGRRGARGAGARHRNAGARDRSA